MEQSLITTKLFIPPAPPELVRRPRLLVRIQTALSHKLTLVSAPAGFGKTTLLSEWASQVPPGIRVAWVSLEAAESDPGRFWDYFIAAVRTIRPGTGESALPLLPSTQPFPVEAVLTILINDLATIPGDFIVILDDYHVIDSEPVHQGVTYLLEHLPVQMHLIITARGDPPLPLSRFRGRGLVLEIRTDDLRFNREEATSLVGLLNAPPLAETDVAALTERTEGWVVGLKMALLSMSGQKDIAGFIAGFTGTQRYIMDYLIEEVLQRQSSDVRDFLLKTSVLERLSGPLCDTVTGRHDGQEMLIGLEKANLFLVPLDESRRWYRYEHLFAELLRHRLEAEFGLEKYNELHRLASGWHEGNGFPDKAVDHALAARDWERAIDLVMSKPMANFGASMMCNWLRQVPLEVLRVNPQAYASYAWSLVQISKITAGADLLDSFETSAVYDNDTAWLIAMARMHIAMFQGDPRIEEYARKALSLGRQDNIQALAVVSSELGIYYLRTHRYNEAEPLLTEAYKVYQQQGATQQAVNTLTWLGHIAFLHGKLRQAEEMLKQSIDMAKSTEITELQHFFLGLVYFSVNDVEGAAAEWEKAKTSPQPFVKGLAYLYSSAVGIVQGDIRSAAGALEKAEQVLITEYAAKEDLSRVAAFHIVLALEENDQAAVSRWLDKLAEHEDQFLTDAPARARHLLYEKQGEARRERLQAQYEHFHREGYRLFEMGVRLHQALLSTDPDEALVFLAEALAMARPENNIRIFANFHTLIVPLLRRAIPAGIEVEFARKILRVIANEARQRGIRKGEIPTTAGILSERETEVLHLVADGLSNQQIAARLVISLSTAKNHVHSIIEKLEARGRTEAVTRARELGLI